MGCEIVIDGDINVWSHMTFVDDANKDRRYEMNLLMNLLHHELVS
jgi:hypothetical protein